jgi:hypothetical protein
MASNLVVENVLSKTAQPVKDEKGNTSPLILSTEKVGIGTTNPEELLSLQENGAGESAVFRLRRSDPQGGAHQSVTFRLNPTEGVFILDIGGLKNSHARIHLGDTNHGSNPVTTLGNVGIGTTNPNEKLDVKGNIVASGDVRLSGADCAEEFDILEENGVIEPGSVMVITEDGKLEQCAKANDKRVAGVISGAGDYKPGIVLDRQNSLNGRKPVALNGKVYCKVDAQYGQIEVGDLLTTSPTSGHAMKADDPVQAFGAVIGKALRPLTEGQSLIPILVALQ